MTDYTTYYPDSVLFERNPVCGVCWRVCKEMSDEWGGPIQFDLMASMEAADRLCQRLISNAWTLKGIEYYYHWLEAQLGFSRAAITCAAATVCLSLRLMDDAPEPLQQMGEDMQCLLWGEGGELYDNMRCAARQQDIYLTATQYGEIPPDPNEAIKAENLELKYKVEQLTNELQTMSNKINQLNIGTYNDHSQDNHREMTVHVSGNVDLNHLVRSFFAEDVTPEQEVQAVHESEPFKHLTPKCIEEKKAATVEAEIRAACKGTAEGLWRTLWNNENLGYVSVEPIDATTLYRDIEKHYGKLPYSDRQFRSVRAKR